MNSTRAAAFNEWMRRYTEEPEEFKGEWESIRQFLREHHEGLEPTYGENCDAYLAKLEAELAEAADG